MDMSKIVFCVELGQPIPLKTFKIVRALSLLEYIFPSPVLSGTFEKEFFTQAIIYGVEKSFSLKGDDIRHYLEPGEIMVAAFQEDGTKLLLLRRSIRES